MDTVNHIYWNKPIKYLILRTSNKEQRYLLDSEADKWLDIVNGAINSTIVTEYEFKQEDKSSDVIYFCIKYRDGSLTLIEDDVCDKFFQYVDFCMTYDQLRNGASYDMPNFISGEPLTTI